MAGHASRSLLFACGAAAALALAGCEAVSDMGSYGLVMRDRYSASPCSEIVAMRAAMIKREEELMGLIEKADSGLAGFVVSATTYRSELGQARAHSRALAAAAREKGCDAPGK